LAFTAALTDGRGKSRITMRMIDADEERQPLWEYGCEEDLSDPHRVFELGLNIENIEFIVPAGVSPAIAGR